MGERWRQAIRLSEFHRYVDVWCAMMRVVAEAEEQRLFAWCRYRRKLLYMVLGCWERHSLRSVAVRETCRISRARFAMQGNMRYMLHIVLEVLTQLGAQAREEATLARQQVEERMLRRHLCVWRLNAGEIAMKKQCISMKQFSSWLRHRLFHQWVAGARQSVLDRQLEEHRKHLNEKVSGWLREMDPGYRSKASLESRTDEAV